MKKVICLITGSIFALNVFAQSADMNSGASDPWMDKYCAKMKDGKTVVMHNDKELTADVTTSNGAKIKTDGTVIKKDGTTMMLKDGQCVNTEGNLEKKGMMKKETQKKETKKETKKENKTGY